MRYLSDVLRGGGTVHDVSLLWFAGSVWVMGGPLLQLDHSSFCKTCRDEHLPVSGLVISDQIVTVFLKRWISSQSPVGSSALHHFNFVTGVHGLHTVEPYSSWGRTIVLYAVSQTPGCLHLIFRLMNPRDFLVLDVILLIWVLNFRLAEMSTPRYLAEETNSRPWLCMV